ADFGLVGQPAVVDDRDDGRDTRLTRHGSLMGTPAYMAPEQHARREAGAAADQFAFCVSLWEALHGARPFDGDSRDALAAASERASEARPPAGSEAPAWLCDALRRGLACDPGARWPSMDALLAALVRDPAVARRRRATIAAGVVLAVGVIAYAVTRGSAELGC